MAQNKRISITIPAQAREELEREKQETGKSITQILKQKILTEPVTDPTITLEQILLSLLQPTPSAREYLTANIFLTEQDKATLQKLTEQTGLNTLQIAWKQLNNEDYRLLTEKTTWDKKVRRLIHLVKTKRVK